MPPTKNKRITLQQLLEGYESSRLDKEEFLEAVAMLVGKLDERMGRDKSELDKALISIAEKFTKLRAEVATEIGAARQGLTDSEKAAIQRLDAKMSALEAQIKARVAELKDGESPAVEAIVKNLIPFIPPPIQGSPDMAEDIRNKLELLEGDERLKIDSIKDLREELGKIKKMIKREATMFAGGGIRVQQSLIFPAETLDDSTTTYTFGQKPQRVVVNGASYREGKGWSWVNEQVVLDNPVGSQGDLYGLL